MKTQPDFSADREAVIDRAVKIVLAIVLIVLAIEGWLNYVK